MDKFTRMIDEFVERHGVDPAVKNRIPDPHFEFIGQEIWDKAVAAILAGKNLLLVGEKSTGKNVLAENLAHVFGRPLWDVSLNINIDAASLIGADTLKGGNVVFQPGPVYEAARYGGFCVLDEINMAKNEALAVLHSSLDFRRSIDVPGYSKIDINEAARFIATMNYGYAGTRDLNEALLSRFVVIEMPELSEKELEDLFKKEFPDLKDKYLKQFAALFVDLRKKADAGEISNACLDIRGLIDGLQLMKTGLDLGPAFDMTLVDKTFDPFEKDLIRDVIKGRFLRDLAKKDIFGDSHDN